RVRGRGTWQRQGELSVRQRTGGGHAGVRHQEARAGRDRGRHRQVQLEAQRRLGLPSLERPLGQQGPRVCGSVPAGPGRSPRQDGDRGVHGQRRGLHGRLLRQGAARLRRRDRLHGHGVRRSDSSFSQRVPAAGRSSENRPHDGEIRRAVLPTERVGFPEPRHGVHSCFQHRHAQHRPSQPKHPGRQADDQRGLHSQQQRHRPGQV
ncbi:unnamed protein product, partial [Ectocarpus sp. 12 AP-2014]